MNLTLQKPKQFKIFSNEERLKYVSSKMEFMIDRRYINYIFCVYYDRIFFAVDISWGMVYYNTDFVNDTFEGLTTYDTEIFITNCIDTKWFIGSTPHYIFHHYNQPRMYFKFPYPELEPIPKPISLKNMVLINFMNNILIETKIIKKLIKRLTKKI